MTSAPAFSSASVFERRAARETTTTSGTSWAAETSFESSGRRAGGVEDHAPRLVADAVDARGELRVVGQRGADAHGHGVARRAPAVGELSRLSSLEIHLESPVLVATLPSRLMADLKSTHGRPVRACLRKAWFCWRARAASSPPARSTWTPSSRRMPRPRPEAFSVGSSLATTTRADAGREDGVGARRLLALWQHGSSET